MNESALSNKANQLSQWNYNYNCYETDNCHVLAAEHDTKFSHIKCADEKQQPLLMSHYSQHEVQS